MHLRLIDPSEAALFLPQSPQYTIFSDLKFQREFGGVTHWGIFSKNKCLCVFKRLTDSVYCSFNSVHLLGGVHSDSRRYFDVVDLIADELRTKKQTQKLSLHPSLVDVRPFLWNTDVFGSLFPRYGSMLTVNNNCGVFASAKFRATDAKNLNDAWVRQFGGNISEKKRFFHISGALENIPFYRQVVYERGKGSIFIGFLEPPTEKIVYLMFFIRESTREPHLSREAIMALQSYCYSNGKHLDLLGSNSKGTARWKRGLGAKSYLFFESDGGSDRTTWPSVD